MYWSDELKSDISQGDLFEPICIGAPVSPLQPLSRGASMKGGIESWLQDGLWREDASTKLGHFLGRGRLTRFVMVSWDCEYEKSTAKEPILVAPVFSLDLINAGPAREAAVNGERYPFLYLPPIVDVIQASYVDLRLTTYHTKANVSNTKRLASISAEGQLRFHAQLVAFHTRSDLSGFVKSS